jgi:predicted nucleic acid-binding protein
MRIVLDTNVLCRLAERGHSHHPIVQTAVSKLFDNQHELCLVPQVLYEYWVVVTRPVAENGLGMLPTDARRAINFCLEQFSLFRDERGIFPIWQELVETHSVLGKAAHDTRLVAAMQRHGLTHLLTFNVADFRRYSSIELLDPQLITAS